MLNAGLRLIVIYLQHLGALGISRFTRRRIAYHLLRRVGSSCLEVLYSG